jgi:hypothetical protein
MNSKDLKIGVKFVAYDLKSKRKALWGGICTVTSITRNGPRIVSLNAVDCNDQKRVFAAGRKWGFLKRT